MLKKISVLILILLTFSCDKEDTRTVNGGKLVIIKNFKSDFVSARNVDIWLPNGYNDQEKYAVLYMHDGHSLFDSTSTWNGQEWAVDETVTRLLEEKKVRKTIVVGIWNSGKNRQSEYFPQKAFESLTLKTQDSLLNVARISSKTDLYSSAISSDNYLKFITEELKPFVDKNYSTYKDAQNTFIGGSSYGGLVSMYGLCEYPEIFGGAICMSTHWTGTFTNDNNPIPLSFVKYLDEHIPDSGLHKFYFDYGTKTIDSLYEPNQLLIDSIMRKNGYTEKNWLTKKFQDADHSENSWMKRLEEPLVFILE